MGLFPFIINHKLPLFLMFLFVIMNFISYRKPDLIKKISNLGLVSWGGIITIILAMVVFFYDGNSADFIYFRF